MQAPGTAEAEKIEVKSLKEKMQADYEAVAAQAKKLSADGEGSIKAMYVVPA